MFYGTRITYGVSDWQIFRSENGARSVTLGGSWRLEEGAKKAGVASVTPSVRLVSEYDNSCLTDWIKADYIDPERWEVNITVPRGGLYRLESCLDAVSAKSGEHWRFRGDIKAHIGCGDVFAIAGQSNAAGYGKGIAADPPDIRVHVKRNSGRWDMACHPLNDATDAPDCLNAPMGQVGTSPFIAFGRAHADRTGAPVGLIPCAQGGSSIRQWEAGKERSLLDNMVSKIKRAGGVNAILWYQGCADAHGEAADNYEKDFETLVDRARKALGQCVPFYTFQLNSYAAPHDFDGWDRVRQAQRNAARKLKDVFILPTNDLGLSDEIHLSSASNAALGIRLSNQMDSGISAPDLISCKREGNGAILTYGNVRGELIASDTRDPALGFTARDEKGALEIQSVKTENDSATIIFKRGICGRAFVSHEKEALRLHGAIKDSLTYLPALPFLDEEIL